MNKKVFGIGFHKTGTSTLKEVFKILGYKVCPQKLGYALMPDWIEERLGGIIELAEDYEAFQDSPWCHLGVYKVLDESFPESKFILTKRNENNWLDSLKRQIERLGYSNYSRQNIFLNYKNYSVKDFWIKTYGFFPENNEEFLENKEKILHVYNSYNDDVVNYFINKYKDNLNVKLLVIDWEAGSDWNSICAFLEKDCNYSKVPWKNKGK